MQLMMRGLIPGGGTALYWKVHENFGAAVARTPVMPDIKSLPVIPEVAHKRDCPGSCCHALLSRQIPDRLAPAFRPGLDFRDDG